MDVPGIGPLTVISSAPVVVRDFSCVAALLTCCSSARHSVQLRSTCAQGFFAGLAWKGFETYSQYSFRNLCLVSVDWVRTASLVHVILSLLQL